MYIYFASTDIVYIPLTNRVRGPYSTDREDDLSKIFIISIVCLTSSGTISIFEEQLQISKAGRKQKESI